MAKTKNVSRKLVVRRLVLRTSRCGKAKNKRFPYSSLTMRRSLAAYRRSTKYPDNDARLRMVMSRWGLAEPSAAKRPQLCRYVVNLNQRPNPGSKARRLRPYLHARAPVVRLKLPACRDSFTRCGRSCISTNRTCRKKPASNVLVVGV